MTQQVVHGQMGGDTVGPEEVVQAGAVSFGLEYRSNVGGKDEGICIHVYGNDIPGDDQELLRLDCFKIHPHYHYRNVRAKQNIRLELDFTAEGDPLAWALDKIRNRLPIMLIRSGADDVVRKLEQRDVNAALPKIIAWAESKTNTAISRSQIIGDIGLSGEARANATEVPG